MNAKNRDKEVEYARYNNGTGEKLQHSNVQVEISGSAVFPKYLQSPYVYYEELIARHIKPEMTVLDLCCGDGIHTVSLARSNAKITALDIAENSIKLAKLRTLRAGLNNVEFLVGDAETIDLGEQQFDVITCVGSLSYMDLPVLISQVKKHLKPGGKFICLDSFDHNMIYRINRFIHYLRGQRSWSTLVRMPNRKTIAFIKQAFRDVEIKYFGVFCFVGPVISKIFGQAEAKEIIDTLDRRLALLKKYSFKFVLLASVK